MYPVSPPPLPPLPPPVSPPPVSPPPVPSSELVGELPPPPHASKINALPPIIVRGVACFMKFLREGSEIVWQLH